MAEVEDKKILHKTGLILDTFKKLFPEPPEPFHAQCPITVMFGSEENGWKIKVTPKLPVEQ